MIENENEAKQKIVAAMSGLDQPTRESVLRKVAAQFGTGDYETGLRELQALRMERERLATKLGAARGQMIDVNLAIEGMERIEAWALLDDHKLEKNECSRLHKLAEAIQSGRVIDQDGTMLDGTRPANVAIWANAQPFVVQNDWAAAFTGATDYVDGDFRLPYTHCAFEFRISGRTVIIIAFQVDPDIATEQVPGPQLGMPYVDCGNGYWYFGGKAAREDKVMQYAWLQIRAISVALDAEVAFHEPVRAPTTLNARRLKDGKIPLYGYHIVKLRGRAARPSLPGTGGSHRSPRLHFRRGHWRHYEAHKTWIRWMLVGDPELGFIDKSYRL